MFSSFFWSCPGYCTLDWIRMRTMQCANFFNFWTSFREHLFTRYAENFKENTLIKTFCFCLHACCNRYKLFRKFFFHLFVLVKGVCGLVPLNFLGADVSAQTAGVFLRIWIPIIILCTRVHIMRGGGITVDLNVSTCCKSLTRCLAGVCKTMNYSCRHLSKPCKNHFILLCFSQNFNFSHKILPGIALSSQCFSIAQTYQIPS